MISVDNQYLEHKADEVKKRIVELNRNVDNQEALAIVEDVVLNGDDYLSLKQYEEVIKTVYYKTRSKIGVLERFMNDEDVNEIMVNGPTRLFVERRGGIITEYRNTFSSEDELENVIRNIASGVNREINEISPILDARLSDGSRVNAVYKNVALNGPVLTIRKFSKNAIAMDDMIRNETVSQECVKMLKILVRCGYNIFISGGTSSGKTTFLNTLSEFIPDDERVIVIEDSAELRLEKIPNLVQLECHNANSMGQGKISMASLIKASLRMRPDRIVVGEVRGAEVSDMLQAMNTGHDGCMSTGHANSVKGMLRRLEAMYLMDASIPIDAIRAQIVEGIDIMIHLGRLDNGQRKVMEVQELLDFNNNKYELNPLFVLDESLKLIRTENHIINNGKLKLKGFE